MTSYVASGLALTQELLGGLILVRLKTEAKYFGTAPKQRATGHRLLGCPELVATRSRLQGAQFARRLGEHKAGEPFVLTRWP